MGGTVQSILLTGVVSAILAILGFVLYRSEKAATTANTAMTTLGGAVRLTAALRAANDRLQDRLNEWKDWGGEVVDRDQAQGEQWERLRASLTHTEAQDIGEWRPLPKPPANALDLSDLFKDL
jgi:hypothetical protein